MWNQSRLGDAGIDQDRAQPGTAVGERRQLGVGGLANLFEATLDQRFDRRIGLCDRGEHLTGFMGRLDVAQTDLQMPLALLAAANEGRVQDQGDRRRSRWLCRGGVAQLLADHQGAPAHGLAMDPGIDRQKMFK